MTIIAIVNLKDNLHVEQDLPLNAKLRCIKTAIKRSVLLAHSVHGTK